MPNKIFSVLKESDTLLLKSMMQYTLRILRTKTVTLLCLYNTTCPFVCRPSVMDFVVVVRHTYLLNTNSTTFFIIYYIIVETNIRTVTSL